MATGVGAGSKRNRVGNVSAFFIIATAVIFDAAQFFLNFIPVLGQVAGLLITFLAATIFAIWFLLLGVSYFGGKKAGLKIAAAFGSIVTELVPIVSALPAITLGVFLIIMATWAEDRGPSTNTLRQSRKLASIAHMRNVRAQRKARGVGQRLGLPRAFDEGGE